MFGAACDPKKFSDMAWLNPTDSDKVLMKRGTSFFIELIAYDTEAVDSKGQTILGSGTKDVILWHSAYGTGGIKTNSKTDDPAAVFNPYCKTATGQVTGQYQVTSEVPFAWDPVNKGEKTTMPVIGTFKITYNPTMTERIRRNC